VYVRTYVVRTILTGIGSGEFFYYYFSFELDYDCECLLGDRYYTIFPDDGSITGWTS